MGFFKNLVKAFTNPATLVSAVAATLLAPATGGSSLVFFAKAYAITATATAALQTLSPKPKLPSFSDFATQSQSRTQLIKQPTVPRRIIYGETRVSGVLGFVETTDNNRYINLVILLATHEVNQIGTVYINDEALTLDGSGNATAPSKYSGLVRVKKHLGTDGQSADTDLIASSNSKWTSNHKLSGIAYIYVRLEFSADAFPNGLPNISALVQGKKVYDPRTTNTSYSTNPALCIRDYLTDSKYGFGASSSEIDDTAFTTAANICDETVSLNAGGTETKYTLNGTFESNATPKQTLENLLTAMGGTVVYSNGTFKVKAAKYVSPTVTIGDGDIRGAIGLQTARSQRDNFNAVKGVFTSPTNNFIAADYPAFTSSTFETEDGGDRKFLDMDLPFTTSQTMAQRLSKIALFRNRQKVTMTMFCSLKAFQLDVGDTVQVNNNRFGFTNKVFEVAEWGLAIQNDDGGNPVLGVDLTLRETNTAVYTWTPSSDEKVFQEDNTTLPDAFTVQPPASVTLSDQLIEYNDGTVIVALDITVGASVDPFVSFYQVEYKLSTDSDFIIYAQGSGLNHRVLNVIDQSTYDVRVKAVNTLGVSSSYVTAQRQIIGAIAPPSDVTDFSANVSGQEAHLSWEAVTDLDLAYYNLRFSEATDGSADWLNSVSLVEKISRPATSISVPARKGTYLIKAVDKLGNFSSNATAIISNVTSPINFNAVATQSEHPTFGGTFTNTVLTDSAIELDSSELFDSASGNFDDETTRFFDSGVANADFVSSGNYEFANVIDIGAKHTARITASLTQTADNPDDLFDNRTGNFDDASSNFDGDTPANCNAHLEIATSDDNSTFTDFRNFVIGEYEARYFKFRVVLISRDNASTPVVSEVTVTIDMQDRIFSDNDIHSWGNQVPDSEAFDNWTAQNNGSATADQIANPINGQVTADLISKTTTNYGNVYKDFTSNDAGTYSVSIYAKSGSFDIVELYLSNTAQSLSHRAKFNLTSESVLSTVSSTGAISAVGSDGWYRVSMLATITFNTTARLKIYPNGIGSTVAGNIYVWGAQVQQSSILPDYESYSNSTGTKTITFSQPFLNTDYAVGVTGQTLNTGDYFNVTSKTVNGFNLQFLNSSDNGVGRTFDFIAKGT